MPSLAQNCPNYPTRLQNPDGTTNMAWWRFFAAIAAQFNGSAPAIFPGFIFDTTANMVNYPALTYPAGTQYGESDPTRLGVVYIDNGTDWVYLSGEIRDVIANRPATFGANDAGILFYATDEQITYRWDGATWAMVPEVPADTDTALVLGSNAGRIYAAALPNGFIWQGNASNLPALVTVPVSANVLATDANSHPVPATLGAGDIWQGDGSAHPAAMTPPTSAPVLATDTAKAIVAATLPNSNLWVGSSLGFPLPQPMSGDASISNTCVLTLITTGVSSGTYGDSTHVAAFSVDAKGRITGASNVAISFPPTVGFSGTITLAALTGGGTTGSLTILNGLITAAVNPT